MGWTQLCTFVVDAQLFGVDVHRVREVNRLQDITPVPLAPAALRGLMNLRGEIVAAIDLRERLALGAEKPGAEPALNVVVCTNEGLASLRVDEIDEVKEIDETLCEDPPATLGERVRPFVSLVYKFPERLMLVLDVDQVCDLDFEPSAS